MELTTIYKEVKNEEKNGIELYFEAIPTKEEREALKANGYKWHNAKKCWYKRIGASVKQAPQIKLGVEKMEHSYSGYGWRGVNCNANLSMKDMAKAIKQELKRLYPEATFSVRTDGNAYYSSLSIYLMKSTKNPFESYENAVKSERFNSYIQRYCNESEIEREREHLKKRLESGYSQINQYSIDSDYELNDYGKKIMTTAKDLSDSFNYDDSDSMTDYFNCGHYLHLQIGDYDKPFELIK